MPTGKHHHAAALCQDGVVHHLAVKPPRADHSVKRHATVFVHARPALRAPRFSVDLDTGCVLGRPERHELFAGWAALLVFEHHEPPPPIPRQSANGWALIQAPQPAEVAEEVWRLHQAISLPLNNDCPTTQMTLAWNRSTSTATAMLAVGEMSNVASEARRPRVRPVQRAGWTRCCSPWCTR